MTGLVVADPTEWDADVLVGYRPTREVPDLSLAIGSGSKLRSGTVIYLGSQIGHRLDTGHHVVIREENRIGDECCVWSNSTISYGCIIGHRVRIHANVFICEYSILEDDVFVGPGVTMTNDLHPGCSHSRPCMRGPIIRRKAQIGANVTLLPRVEIGEGAVIGAGSVVITSIPPRMVAVGSPARVIGSVADLTCETGLVDRPYPDPHP